MIFSDDEKSAFKPQEKTTFWEWLPKNFILTADYSEVVGPYPTELVPTFKILADWIDDPAVSEVIVRKSTQIGLTTLVVAWFVYRQFCQPGPGIFCMSDQATTEEMSIKRFKAGFENAKCFEKIKTKTENKGTEVQGGGSIKMAWASSISAIASTSTRDYAADEITKPGYSAVKKEGNAVGRLRYRAHGYPHTAKGWIMSTVTIKGDEMDKLEQKADCVYRPFVPCPHCSQKQPLFFFPGETYYGFDGACHQGGYVFFETAAGSDKYKRAASARYVCGNCGAAWTNEEKNAALQLVDKHPDRPIEKEGSRRFIHIWRIHEVRESGKMSGLVLEYLEALESGDDEDLQNFYNNALALYWSKVVFTPEDAIVKASVIEYSTEILPETSLALVCTVDQQKFGYWYLVRAWANNGTSWKIEHGFLSSEAELNQLLFEKTWNHPRGRMGLWRIGVDTGGGEREESTETATEWVYLWYLRNLRRGPQIVLCKGASRRQNEEIRIGEPIITLPSGKKLPQALRLVMIDTHRTKNTFFYRIAQAKEETPICPAYVSGSEKDEYFKHISAEQKIKDGKKTMWKRKGSQANHLLDCEQMQVAVTSKLLRGGVFLLQEPVGIVEASRPEPRDINDDDDRDNDNGRTSRYSRFRRR